MSRGLFVTFEGVDGCGKTTQVARAAALMSRRGVEHVVTREPGGSEVGERLRELLISPEYREMGTRCEVLLYLAARAQHVDEVIRPALAGSKVVLCDRFQEATLAYQGFGRGVDRELLRRLNSYATGGLEPDHTFVFDVDVDEAHRRRLAMGKVSDRMESSSRDFHERVRRGYLDLAARSAERMTVLDGAKGPDELAEEVAAALVSLTNP